MTKRTSTSFIGSFSPESANDMLKLQELRDMVSYMNKETGLKRYIKLQGRGKNRLERALPYYNKKYGKEWVASHMWYVKSRVAQSLPVEVAEYYDAYIYTR